MPVSSLALSQLELLRADHTKASGKWMMPFVALCAAAAVIGLWGIKQWQSIKKMDKQF